MKESILKARYESTTVNLTYNVPYDFYATGASCALVVYFHLPTYSVVQKILSTARRNKNKKGRLKPGNEKMYVMHY